MNLDPMWEALAGYQIYAEKHGFGAEWLRMTTERTREAAWAAYTRGGWSAARGRAAYEAERAVYWTSWGVLGTLDVEQRMNRAITLITRAIELEQKSEPDASPSP